MSGSTEVAVVVIGRNEGDRLKRSLTSVRDVTDRIVYVDSLSSDGSADWSRGQNLDVIEIDSSAPLSAARARNAGFERARQLFDPHYVQFVDGDCELDEAWLERGARLLDERDDVAAVCGRVAERDPDGSLYNRLMAIELDKAVGEVRAFGGIFMIRTEVFADAGGFDPAVVAGEEPELSFRIRQQGWKILGVDEAMVSHEAEIGSFSQWWKRMVRGGHAYAQGMALHGRSKEHYYVRESLSIGVWAAVLPLLCLALVPFTEAWSLLGLVIYPLQLARVWWRHRSHLPSHLALAHSTFCLLAKFAQLQGYVRYWRRTLFRLDPALIEYKRPES